MAFTEWVVVAQTIVNFKGREIRICQGSQFERGCVWRN